MLYHSYFLSKSKTHIVLKSLQNQTNHKLSYYINSAYMHIYVLLRNHSFTHSLTHSYTLFILLNHIFNSFIHNFSPPLLTIFQLSVYQTSFNLFTAISCAYISIWTPSFVDKTWVSRIPFMHFTLFQGHSAVINWFISYYI